jgi:hypothetical protein
MDQHQTSTNDVHSKEALDENRDQIQVDSTIEARVKAHSEDIAFTDKELAPAAEPDWDELCKYEPSRASIRTFLGAREKRRRSMQRLQDFLDEAHAALQKDVLDSIWQQAVNVHRVHEKIIMSLEQDIEHHVMQNHNRREDLRRKLYESEQQARGLFANLQARLAH